MRIALAALVLALFLGPAPVYAQEPDADVPPADPNQWTITPEGNRHIASGTNCTGDVVGFAPLVFMPGDANALGFCSYTDVTGTGDAGLSVRRYMPGIGETDEAVANDRSLMEPDPAQGAPLFTVRMAPAALRDGSMGGRVTITKVKNGFLVDCFAEGVSLQAASAKLALVCSN